MRRTVHTRNRQNRASQAGLLVAAASAPNTFQRTLMPRNTTDQGLITGITMATNYSLASTICKVLEDVADQLAGTADAKDTDYKAHRRQRRFTMALDALAIAGSYAIEKKLQDKPAGDQQSAIVRTAAGWVRRASIASLTVGVLQEAIELSTEPTDKEGNRRVTKLPVGVVGGAFFAAYSEYRRRQSEKGIVFDDEEDIKPLQALAMGLGVMAVLGAISFGQRKVADELSKQMNKVLPGSQDFWWSLGHVTAIGATGMGVAILMRRVYRKIEEVASHIETAFDLPPTSKLVSGGPGSLVDWSSLSVQGRRFVSTAVSKQQIKDVMGQSAKADPIRCYVGLDSAETEKERLDLALFELERTNAFDRSAILLISPTGTGYVNYVAVEAAELMSRGDFASIALQYSKRPSPMSLDRVSEGRLQFRMLVKAVDKRISELPAKSRPKLYVFGESLGAWTSQDAFIDQGTDGLVNAGIDKAIWIGSPYGSKWKTQVLGNNRPDVEPELVGKFDNIDELAALEQSDRSSLRYCMITHDNDPVALFGASLIFQKPDWLTEPDKRPPTVSHSQYYTSPGTFLLTLVDMKNAMNVIPGQFEASGHDYRADLAAFVREVFDFTATTDAQFKSIEKQLRKNELDRATRLGENKTTTKSKKK